MYDSYIDAKSGGIWNLTSMPRWLNTYPLYYHMENYTFSMDKDDIDLKAVMMQMNCLSYSMWEFFSFDLQDHFVFVLFKVFS